MPVMQTVYFEVLEARVQDTQMVGWKWGLSRDENMTQLELFQLSPYQLSCSWGIIPRCMLA